MAYVPANSSNNWILSLKLVLISTGVLSLAVMLKLSLPMVSDFIAYEIPSIWSFLLSWLRPPYLYIVINFIIISIVASSKMQQKTDYPEPEMPVVQPPQEKVSRDVQEDSVVYGDGVIFGGSDYDMAKVSVSDVQVVDSEGACEGVEKKAVSDVMLMNASEEAVLTRSAWTGSLQRKDSLEVFISNNENEKPPVSVRFAHRRPLKASPEAGKALRVSKPKRQETLENTWKTITEGRSMPLTRHLKKSDTWESHMRHNQPTDENTPPRVKKSETFSDRSANSSLSPSPVSGRLRKEPSLGQDELNRRVEAFIKKFNEEMRLQRQESLNQYHEMIRRGAH
ncbi:hypothetical protein F2P56_005273 [Juglans regia]|uniref:Uncharacterized protein LOC109013898 n=2 Tax=Juglans regia TaxID=51240 RepID=A0A2I4H6B9_JUGRE|nr:uncharacterized protein LOC109013898 [Juglans regia]KAF5478736.1 hypothetical protein F2P56_005273 [Juglans regia]